MASYILYYMRKYEVNKLANHMGLVLNRTLCTITCHHHCQCPVPEAGPDMSHHAC